MRFPFDNELWRFHALRGRRARVIYGSIIGSSPSRKLMIIESAEIYRKKVHLFTMPGLEKTFDQLLVRDVASSMIIRPSMIDIDSSIREVIDEMLKNPITRKVYAVDSEGKLVGMVTTETLLRLIGYRVGVRTGTLSFYKFLRDALRERVKDVMEGPVFVKQDAKLKDALLKMLDKHLNDIPVVDENGMLIGELNSLELFNEARDLFDQDLENKRDSDQP